MIRLIPVCSLLFNFYFFVALESVISSFIPGLPFNSLLRSSILFLLLLFVLYTPTGQRTVAFLVKGRNTIGREEKVLEPIIERLKQNTDIKGYSKPVLMQFKILNALNKVMGKRIKSLDRRVNRIKYEFQTGTVKIFTFDSLDIETNSYGNSIFISKGAIDTLTKDELEAVIYNEFAQIKTNIANKRLLHDAGILIGRVSAVMILLLAPFGLAWSLISGLMSFANGGSAQRLSFFAVLVYFLIAFQRILVLAIFKLLKINFTQLPYMFYERKIFIAADRATFNQGYAKGMLRYLEKLYVFKLDKKALDKLFVELRPLVAYRINYFDNLLGNNKGLSAENYAWSSNYMERVQVINNQKE